MKVHLLATFRKCFGKNLTPTPLFMILLCFFFFQFKAVYGEETTFTLPQAIEQAVRANPILRAVESQTEEAFYSYRANGSLPNALLTGNYTGGNNTVIANNGQPQDVNLVFQQSFGPIGNIALAGKQGFQNYQIAQATLGETRLSLVQNVKDGFYGLLSAQSALKEVEENLKLAHELYNLAHEKHEAGAAPQTDLLNAEIQKASVEQNLIQAEAARKQAEIALNPLLGRPASKSLEVTGPLELAPIDLDFETLLAMAQKNRPLLKGVELGVESARTGVDFARSLSHPAPALFFNYDLSTSPLYLFGASLQFPIFDYGQIRNQVSVEEKIVAEKQNLLNATRLNLSSSVKSAYEAYRAAYDNASTFQKKVLSPSEKLMNITEFGYREGALPYLQVVVAEQNLKSARSQYLSLLLAGHQAMDALEAAVGESLEGNGK